MCKVRQMLVLWIAAGLQLSFSEPYSFFVDRQGRAIQADGFLLEWAEKDAASSVYRQKKLNYDAVNTPQGVAGYVRVASPDTCQPASFLLGPGVSSKHLYMTIGADAAPTDLHAVQKGFADTDTSVTVEWIVPKAQLIVNDSGNYTVALTIITSCRDTIPPVVFLGRYSVSEGKKPSTGSATTKGILIGVLLLLFLALRRKTEKFRKKTGGYQ